MNSTINSTQEMIHFENFVNFSKITNFHRSSTLIHRKFNPYGKDFELIIVPNALAAGLISALHLRLGHPTKTQFKKLWGIYFFAIA